MATIRRHSRGVVWTVGDLVARSVVAFVPSVGVVGRLILYTPIRTLLYPHILTLFPS